MFYAHSSGVGLFIVILQDSGHSKIGHFAYQVLIHQDVAGSQVSVNVTHVWQVGHAHGDAAHHAHKLQRRELAITWLSEEQEQNECDLIWGGKTHFLNATLTRRKESRAPFSMYSITIITGRPGKWGKRQDWSEDQREGAAVLVVSGLTLGDHSLQPDDVGVVELSNDWSLAQKLSLLLFPLAGSQRLYSYSDVHPSRHVQPTPTDFSKFTCQSKTAWTRQRLNP